MWFGEMAKRTGDSAESIKYEMKKKFLAKIYLRDNAETQEAYEAVIAYRDVIKHFRVKERKYTQHIINASSECLLKIMCVQGMQPRNNFLSSAISCMLLPIWSLGFI
ncbi:hypothetical protein [Acinetobacter baumannii]|uniref:hypothetical protein n=1 Tax=Acinetobacter baumannii TaxID=470 RepID=UPI0039753D88